MISVMTPRLFKTGSASMQFLQNLPRPAALSYRHAQRVVVGGVVNGLVGRAAAQKKLADIAVGDDGFQLALRRNEAKCAGRSRPACAAFQHRGGQLNKEFFYLYQGWIPLLRLFKAFPSGKVAQGARMRADVPQQTVDGEIAARLPLISHLR